MKKTVTLTLFTLILTGCGQSGALYLPPPKATTPTPGPNPALLAAPKKVPMMPVGS